MKVKEL